ncbi:MAG: hypothetical protein MJZ11_00505 [Lachnospiraceae bacterium]|nr:hypothetical protein [Lachnospiraceae bacterium]
MATHKVDPDSIEILNTISFGDADELNELKAFLFRENIRIEMEKKELEELKKEVLDAKARLRNESDEVNKQIVIERKRLKDEQLFFSKKMEILKNGFEALEADRKALENSRKQFERERYSYSYDSKKSYNSSDDSIVVLFKGVNSLLSLKKRYKDLLKIFHPDNMSGDHEMVLAINQIYEELKKNYESSKII